MAEFENRHIVITGGRGNLGTAVVQALLAQGAWCHVPDIAPETQHHGPTEERLQIVSGVDLTDEEAVQAFYAGLPPIWASIHLAGGFAMQPVVETRLADFKAQFDSNVITCFLCCREAIRVLRAQTASTTQGGGRIVNVAARPALVPIGGMVAYSVAKTAVAALTQSLAEEVKQEGILVNAIAPSVIDSPQNRQAMPNADHATWPTPAEIAETILFLASPRNTLTSGAIISVYGRA